MNLNPLDIEVEMLLLAFWRKFGVQSLNDDLLVPALHIQTCFFCLLRRVKGIFKYFLFYFKHFLIGKSDLKIPTSK